jgi:hypothetical protein
MNAIMMNRVLPATSPAITVCWGAGVDSTAMLIGMYNRGIRPDLITFADVGAEKQDTYEFIPIFSSWLERRGFPRPVICSYQPQAKTAARYRAAVERAVAELGLDVSEARLESLSRIYGNLLANETLPSQAFGMKSCSLKWKVTAQEMIRPHHPALLQTWEAGLRVRKLIGFDSTETHRTFADHKAGVNIGAAPGVPHFDQRYSVEYPLQAWGWDRERCMAEIADAGLPVPTKSACFCCPAMRPSEIAQLQTEDPVAYKLAMHLEATYRQGPHFRGDDLFTVSARHKLTGERERFEVNADSAADARAKFRAAIKDTGRVAMWKITSVSPSVRGLGRSFSWASLQPMEV